MTSKLKAISLSIRDQSTSIYLYSPLFLNSGYVTSFKNRIVYSLLHNKCGYKSNTFYMSKAQTNWRDCKMIILFQVELVFVDTLQPTIFYINIPDSVLSAHTHTRTHTQWKSRKIHTHVIGFVISVRCLIPSINFCVNDGYENPKLILANLSKKGFY